MPAGAVSTDGDDQFCAGEGNHQPISVLFDEQALIEFLAKPLDECGYTQTYHTALLNVVGQLKSNRSVQVFFER